METIANSLMTKAEIKAALIAAGFASELKLKKSDLKYDMTLYVYQLGVNQFRGRLVRNDIEDGLVTRTDIVTSPVAVIQAVKDAGYLLCYVVKIDV